MKLSEFARNEVVFVSPEAPVAEAARLMQAKNVGCVVVANNHKPVGILTDRDIVLRLVNRDWSPTKTPVREIMTENVLTLRHDMQLDEALDRVKGRSIRRFPVVDEEGAVVGFFSMDDIVHQVGREMNAVASILENERAFV
jgi:CBS domain-containing protein